MIRNIAIACAVAAVAWLSAAPSHAQNVKLGVLGDHSGPYSDTSGLGTVEAVKIAVEQFKQINPSLKVELVMADHQNKPDIASSIAKRWYDAENVDAIVDIQNSSVALAVQFIASQSRKISLVTAATTPELYGKSCSATGIHWAMDAYALAAGPIQALTDKKRWFFITVDLAGGHLFEREGEKAVVASGGDIVGRARHPLGTQDMSSYLLRADSSGAQVIGLANAGADAINAIKGAAEFGLRDKGISLAPLLLYDTDIKAIGLQLTQGMVIGTGFYWDLNDHTRAFSKLFGERFMKRTPTQNQASAYSATLHYLKAVTAVGTTDSAAVMAKMRELPVDYMSGGPGRVRPDGRVIYDVHVMQIKKPQDSRSVDDILTVLRSLPGDKAFLPIEVTECPLVRKG